LENLSRHEIFQRNYIKNSRFSKTKCSYNVKKNLGINPFKKRPLDERINCIISKKLHSENIHSDINDFVLHFNSFDHALEELESKENVENIYII
jgi:hypothetical protein